MTIKNILPVLLMTAIAACNKPVKDELPADYKPGLLSFTANKFDSTNQSTDSTKRWTSLDKFNPTTSNDTLQVDVNVDLQRNLNYEGGYEFKHDTLILYAANKNKKWEPETDHATLKYKISLGDRKYTQIKFIEYK